jgi:uncharacterized integral membrane protein
VADSAASSQPQRSGRVQDARRLTRLLVAAAALIYAGIFIALNRDKVQIHFLFFTVTSRLWVGFLVCIALGMLVGQTVGLYRRRHRAKADGSG